MKITVEGCLLRLVHCIFVPLGLFVCLHYAAVQSAVPDDDIGSEFSMYDCRLSEPDKKRIADLYASGELEADSFGLYEKKTRLHRALFGYPYVALRKDFTPEKYRAIRRSSDERYIKAYDQGDHSAAFFLISSFDMAQKLSGLPNAFCDAKVCNSRFFSALFEWPKNLIFRTWGCFPAFTIGVGNYMEKISRRLFLAFGYHLGGEIPTASYASAFMYNNLHLSKTGLSFENIGSLALTYGPAIGCGALLLMAWRANAVLQEKIIHTENACIDLLKSHQTFWAQRCQEVSKRAELALEPVSINGEKSVSGSEVSDLLNHIDSLLKEGDSFDTLSDSGSEVSDFLNYIEPLLKEADSFDT